MFVADNIVDTLLGGNTNGEEERNYTTSIIIGEHLVGHVTFLTSLEERVGTFSLSSSIYDTICTKVQ